MNIISLVCCVLLIIDLEVKCERVYHDSIKNNNNNVKKRHLTNIVYDNKNVNIIKKPTTNPNKTNKEISTPKVFPLKVTPVYNAIPRKTLHVLKNAQTPIATAELSNAAKVPMKDKLVENENGNNTFVLSNDTDTLNENNAREKLIQIMPSRNMSVTSNNNVKVISTIDNTNKSINLEERIEKTTKQHKVNKIENKTIETSTVTNQLSETEDVSIDTIHENELKEERVDIKLESSKLLKPLNLSHIDADNKNNRKLIQTDVTSPTSGIIPKIKTNGFSKDSIEHCKPSTQIDDSIILKYLGSPKFDDCGSDNQGLNIPPSTIDNQTRNGTVIYSELWPDFNTRKLFNIMSNINRHQQAKYYNQQLQKNAELFKKRGQKQCPPCFRRHVKQLVLVGISDSRRWVKLEA